MIRALTAAVILYAVLSAGIAAIVYSNALETELSATREAGAVRLAEASSRLRGQLDVYRTLVNIIAQDRRMIGPLTRGTHTGVDAVLKDFSLTFGAWEVDLINARGTIVASSHPERDGVVISAGLVGAANNRTLGYELDVFETTRLVRFSRTVHSPQGDAIGGVVVSADLAALEFEWPVTPEPIVFFDDTGRSVSSNRPELLLLSQSAGPTSTFPLTDPVITNDVNLWTFTSPGAAPMEVVALRKTIPQLDLEGLVLLDTATARSTALLRMLLAIAVMMMLGLIGAVMAQQRRRLSMETRHSATLEARVEARTAELRAAQDELVAASKLAALGRLSAGVSHELNQPLGAILNFAENGKKLLDKQRPSEAEANLSQISDQVRRINRIIGNLRAFARQENTPVERVNLVDITHKSLALMQEDLDKNDVRVTLDLPQHPVPVMAGRIRLEQVIVNLISNAMDAMQGVPKRHLHLHAITTADYTSLTVKDTGTGIQDIDQVFEPFYTTKELGASKGMGMGLALSYGIVARFGGQLTCRNTGTGAAFTLTLPRAKEA